MKSENESKYINLTQYPLFPPLPLNLNGLNHVELALTMVESSIFGGVLQLLVHDIMITCFLGYVSLNMYSITE